MKPLKTAIVFLVVVLGIVASTTASAHGRGRAHFGFHFGAPAFWYPSPYYYYPDPYYHYPRTVVVPGPTQYVEQSPPPPAAASAPPESYWYYCHDSGAYYPHVRDCASPWQRVPPRP